MLSIRKSLFAAGLALALSALSHLPADAQASIARWRGGGNEPLIEQAVRRYGFRPNRLTDAQVRAINDAWTELLGPTTRRAQLNRTQATAIVYMALVQPYEDERTGGVYDAPRDDDRYDRPGGGYQGGRGWSAECDAMEADAYRLGTLVSAPERGNASLFVQEPDKGRARALARRIQEQAVQCRAYAAADRAGDVLTLLSENLPDRADVSRQVDALKRALQDAAPGRPRR
jgi:hypothetical protein